MKYFKCILITILLSYALSSNAQVDARIWQEVLVKKMQNKEFAFINKDGTKTKLKYLGEVIADGKTYKVLTSIWLWNLRATSRILFFNSNNQYVGDYCLTTDDELPYKIESDKLFFKIQDDKCADSTAIDFRHGIPKGIFIMCRGEYGFGSY